MSSSNDENNRAVIQPNAYWIGSYAILVATLYLWGYWSQFGINILEHLSISDVVKSAAYPIASLFVFFVFGVLIAGIAPSDGFMPYGGGANTRTGNFLRRHSQKLIALYLLFVFISLTWGPVEKWEVLPYLLACPAAIYLLNYVPRFFFVRSDTAHYATTLILVALPFFAYGRGVVIANYIVTGKEYQYVVSPVTHLTSKLGTSPGYQLRYIGKASSQYFLYDPEGETVLILPDDGVLELKAFKKGLR